MNAVEVKDLTKVYRLYKKPNDRLREIFSLRRRVLHREHHAVRGVSFSIPRGQTVGILGRNGSGKSTLLKMICGVIPATEGTMQVRGRVAALLELGIGFNPDMTGRDNLFMKAAMMGVPRGQLEQQLPELEAFAGLGSFIDQPMRTYSSGMFVRLAFALAIHVDPDILIVDEAIAVGDAAFQAKCFDRFRAFQEAGKTIILVTHSMGLVTRHCQRGLLLDKGVLVHDGSAKDVVDKYYERLGVADDLAGPGAQGVSVSMAGSWTGMFQLNKEENRYGDRRVEVIEVGLFDRNHRPLQAVERNEEVLVKVKVRYLEDMPSAHIGFAVRDPNGVVLLGTDTFQQGIDMGPAEKGRVALVTFAQRMPLNPQRYLLMCGAYSIDGGDHNIHDMRTDYLVFGVKASQERYGLFDTESVVDWEWLGT